MIDHEYLWPFNVVKVPEKYRTGTQLETRQIQRKVESFLQGYFKYPVLLLPSGRSALSLAMRVNEVKRGDVIFAPKWSSHCVWNIVSRYGNPTCICDENADVLVPVHRAGLPARLSRKLPAKIQIEDSCDILMENPSALFPLGGNCEIISLSKIMGIYGGGILICKEETLASQARKIIQQTPDISLAQGRKRYRISLNKAPKYEDWDACEYKNFSIDYSLVRHIADNLDALARNKQVIRKRLRILRSNFAFIFPILSELKNSLRFPPVIPTPYVSQKGLTLRRHFNINRYLDKPLFQNMTIVPLHFGISDELFESILEDMQPGAAA